MSINHREDSLVVQENGLAELVRANGTVCSNKSVRVSPPRTGRQSAGRPRARAGSFQLPAASRPLPRNDVGSVAPNASSLWPSGPRPGAPAPGTRRYHQQTTAVMNPP